MATDYNMLGDLDLKNLLDRFSNALLRKLNCVKVGKINSFDSTTQTANVEISDYPMLRGVPVNFICGANFSIQVPVEKDDDCIVLFCDTDLDNWVEGNGGKPAFSQDMHGLNGAIAFVGLKNILTKIDNYITNGIRIKYKDTVLEVREDGVFVDGNLSVTGDIISTGKIEAGNGATGTFQDTNGTSVVQTVTVVKGIITNIS